MNQVVTIVIPNYKTPELTELCLASIRKYTDLNRVKILAVDNASGDASAEYLRKLDFVEFLERPGIPGESGPAMHARALDLGLSRCETPFVMVIHTDTIFTNSGWLDFLLGEFENNPKCAGVGSWKLEVLPVWKQFGKKLEDGIRTLLRRKKGHGEERYLRSHCAIYRTEAVRKYTRGFDDGDTAGKSLHRMLLEAGFSMKFLESEKLMKYLRHLNHATMILNPGTGGRKTTTPRARKRIAAELADLQKQILGR